MTLPQIRDDFLRALALLTRLPVRADFGSRTAEAVWAYPLVGVVVGGLAVAAGSGALWLSLPIGTAAAVFLVTQIFLTGALHEDGLADTVDGLWGGWSKERRLEIMKDSRIGGYGVLALCCTVLIRWSLIVVLLPVAPLALVGAAAASRGAMPPLMALLPFARNTGLSHATGRPRVVFAGMAFGLGAIFLLGLAPIAIIAIGITCALVGRLAMAKIGGQTGDILGATQQVTEIAVLAVCAAALT